MIGALVMAYGTPSSKEDVGAFYTHVRRGRPPSPEQLADLCRRYDAIGGTSPLVDRTNAQADGLAAALGDEYQVALGFKHASPFIEDAVGALAASGVDSFVGLVLAPHYSKLSVGEYCDRARAAAGDRMNFSMIESWHLAAGYVDLLAGFLIEAMAEVASAGAVHVVFTAHSLPERILATGDPYPAQLAASAAAIAARADLAPEMWSVAWQSAGRTPEPWIGPDILTVIDTLADTGTQAVVVCAAGFTSDHLEVLYDLDIEARNRAEAQGLGFARTRSLNDHSQLCSTLAAIVRQSGHSAPRRPPKPNRAGGGGG